MEDDECRTFRRLSRESCEVSTQIASYEPRLLVGGNLDRRAQSCQPTRLLGPYQRFQPAHLGGVREVDGLEIEPGPPDDARQSSRTGVAALTAQGKTGGVKRCALGPRCALGTRIGPP